MKPTRRSTVLLTALTLTACAATPAPGDPVGRPITPSSTRAAPANAARASAGDPPAERGGTIPPAAQAAQHTLDRAGLARTPRDALRRYALAYTNWHASALAARERLLAALSIGAARLSAEQTAAAGSGTRALIANRVANTGRILAITPAIGTPHREWVVVTQERTTGSGGYAGLPPGPHVTLAQVEHLARRGWAISAWNPAS